MSHLFTNEIETEAIMRIQKFARIAKAMELPISVGFSGGKDSQVTLHLCKRAGIEFTAYFNHSLESPTTLKFIREHYPDVMEKLNIAELLKDCPKGMELDCSMYDNVTLYGVFKDTLYPIKIETPDGRTFLDKYGCCTTNKHSKCVIFPKGKTTWEGFQKPFKEGDIIYNQCIKATAIFYKQTNEHTISHCFLNMLQDLKIHHYHCKSLLGWRLATEDEKQKLFDAIKANGYKWNAETKTLEKLIEPKFKVGDRIKKKGDTRLITIKDVRDNYYIITFLDDFGNCYITDKLSFSNQGDYELVPNKFDITTLKPFDKVLVRDTEDYPWNIGFFSFKKDEYFMTSRGYYAQCIPYEENKHLLGTINDCNEYFKTWE